MRSVVSVCPAAGSFSLYFLIQLTFGLDLACVSAMAVIRQRSKVKDIGQGKGNAFATREFIILRCPTSILIDGRSSRFPW